MRLWPAPVYTWGSTPAERAEPFPCDEVLGGAELEMFRAVDAEAPAAVVYRWLCQLAVAPYSYDKLDNRGRRSPQKLTPGLDELVVGQRMVSIFRLAAFEPGCSVTLVSHGRLFGSVAMTYRVRDAGPGRSRLVAKLLVVPPRFVPWGLPMRVLLPPGDLVMMRRQLLNLAGLAAGSASR
jgi:hypothetical protein